MSIVDLYKKEFKVHFLDEEIKRSEAVVEHLKKKDFSVELFSSRGLFLESLKTDLPHIFILFYQPLSMKFRELLKEVRAASDEVQVVLLASKDFWPGVQNLMDTGLSMTSGAGRLPMKKRLKFVWVKLSKSIFIVLWPNKNQKRLKRS